MMTMLDVSLVANAVLVTLVVALYVAMSTWRENSEKWSAAAAHWRELYELAMDIVERYRNKSMTQSVARSTPFVN